MESILITYKSWFIRGMNQPCYQVIVNHPSSLLAVKQELEHPPVKGILVIENKSKAVKRLGWKELGDGIYYKIFE